MTDRPRQSGDDIAVFLAVCEAGSFAGAAVPLALTPSAVAKAVGRLEQRLGLRLFHRTTRRLTLTAEAALYRQACLEARQKIDRVEAELAALSSEPSGLVRVSLPPLLGTQIIAPALYALCERWPHLRFDIATSTRQADLPGDGVDLAVRVGTLPELPGLTARRLGVQKLALCAAPAYLAGKSQPRRIEDLANHALIAHAQGGRVVPWHFRSEQGDLRSFEPDARLLLDGSLLTLAAICAGQGLGLVPHWLVAGKIEHGELIPLLEDRIAGHRPVHALWITAPTILPRLRVTIDAIAEATRDLLTP
jgi:DNA-binding transcriptional LysR family regulator